ncbi:hypothetical protein F5887DRAFT_1187547 [Amanita rubescens]|nr:hypothetical protein F5887DRAFT_1187547 [Amanita rubescens]
MSIASILPPEILGAIVLEARPKRRVRYRIPLEVVVSHVCQHWREVVIGTPLLWTHIDVYSDDSMKWVPSYLERSKPCLLDVRIDTYDDEKRLASTIPCTPIIRLLADSHFERVQYFFWLMRGEPARWSHYLEDIAAPVLERFRIVSTRHIRPWSLANPSYTIFAGGAPRLSLVDLLVAVPSLPPLQNVTTLILAQNMHQDPLTIKLIEIMRSAPNLAHLSIGSLAIPEGLGVPFISNSLRSLKFNCDPAAIIIPFLRDLDAPQLESLWLACPPYISLQPFLYSPHVRHVNKFPSLRYLTLQKHDFPNLQDFATAFHNVTHLHLLYPQQSGQGLMSMRQDDPSMPVLWPNLHTLAIQTVHDAYSQSSTAITQNFVAQCRDLCSRRKWMDYRVEMLLFDSDLFRIATNSGALIEASTVAPITRDNYQEYWWNLFEDDTLRML